MISTKVGRLLHRACLTPEGAFRVSHGEVPRFDFSADGVRRSLDESLGRLGVDRVDIVLIHDPDAHLEQAITEAAPVLAALREEGVVGAIGFGMNYVEPLRKAVERCDLDVILVAGRYTLLDQAALDSGLLALVRRTPGLGDGRRRVQQRCAGGAEPRLDLRLPARSARPARSGRLRIAAVCERHGTSLPAAALRFVARSAPHRDGADRRPRRGEIVDDVHLLASPIAEALWSELRRGGPDPRPLISGPRLLPFKSRIGCSGARMARPHDTMMNPRDRGLCSTASDSKFTLVTLAAKRARQINDYFNQLGEGLGAIVPPQVTSVSRKPLSIAFEEIAAGKITYERPEPGARTARPSCVETRTAQAVEATRAAADEEVTE